MRFDRRVFSFLPMILMMCLIFSFSNQSSGDSAGLSYRVSFALVRSADELQGAHWDEEQVELAVESIHQLVRKLAHVAEYFLLTLTVLYPFSLYGAGKGYRLPAAAVCVLYAALDECHQIFIPGRGPSIRDVCIDSVGIAIGLALYQLVCLLRKSHRDSGVNET